MDKWEDAYDELEEVTEDLGKRIYELEDELADLDTLFKRVSILEFQYQQQDIGVTLGVGDGNGNLFVHGSYNAIREVRKVMKRLEDYIKHFGPMRFK